MSEVCLAVVVIGRNEGERLHRCLMSVKASGLATAVVYVDSGSTDRSVDMARSLDCDIVNLDLAIPFTAARARNEGFARALQVKSNLTHVQFVDGDCEIVGKWMETAVSFLNDQPDVAAVCGRRRERYPGNSVYNRLCDVEWNTPIGVAKYCGGDVMVRAQAFRDAGGYRASLIAGEEPELCVRLRGLGWRIWRLDCEMTLHDAAMVRFSQWWNRSRRAGHAFAEGAALHGKKPERHYVRQAVRAAVWGVVLPTGIVLLSMWFSAALWLLMIYPLQIMRIAVASPLQARFAWWRAVFLVIGKFPEAQGLLQYWLNRIRSQSATLIEYK